MSIIQFTDEAKIVLSQTSIQNQSKILDSVNKLQTSGGTNAWPGILLAYKLAREVRSNEEQTKIILITDGDFGGVNNNEFFSLMEKEKKNGIGFSVLGFSIGEKNEIMEELNLSKRGEAFYINSLLDAKKVLSEQSWQTWNSLVKDLSVEVSFNPTVVEKFRLIGSENYQVKKEKQSVEISSGFTHTALYEITTRQNFTKDKELIKVKLNYRTNNGKSEELSASIPDSDLTTWNSTDNFRFAAGVTGLAMLINQSIYSGSLDFNMVIHLIQSSLIYDPDKSRLELLRLTNKIKSMENY